VNTGDETMENESNVISGLIQELRRGSLVLLILSQLASQQYGYSLVQQLEGQGLKLEPGTLYPLLRRLEKQGLLDSQWDVDAGRPRRYYTLSASGRRVLVVMTAEWQNMADLMKKLLQPGAAPGTSGEGSPGEH
jgi:PadR family transcriptional regulator, regulatory protein PadR